MNRNFFCFSILFGVSFCVCSFTMKKVRQGRKCAQEGRQRARRRFFNRLHRGGTRPRAAPDSFLQVPAHLKTLSLPDICPSKHRKPLRRCVTRAGGERPGLSKKASVRKSTARWIGYTNARMKEAGRILGATNDTVLDFEHRKKRIFFGDATGRGDAGLLDNKKEFVRYLSRLEALDLDVERATQELACSRPERKYARTRVTEERVAQEYTSAREHEKMRIEEMRIQLDTLLKPIELQVDLARADLDSMCANKRYLLGFLRRQGDVQAGRYIAERIQIKKYRERLDEILEDKDMILQSQDFLLLPVAEGALKKAEAVVKQLHILRETIKEERIWLREKKVAAQQIQKMLDMLRKIDERLERRSMMCRKRVLTPKTF